VERWIAPLVALCVPIILVVAVLAAKALGLNPKLTPEEKERMIRAVAESEWARALARKMATTPEAQERVAYYLAKSLVEGAERAGL
jgi:hypothetical protein